MNKALSILSITGQIILFVVLIFTVFTFVTSKTGVIASVRSLVVLTGSMEPTLPVGSIVYLHEQLGYNKGDIITFTNNAGQNVTHRITDIFFTETGTMYTTKGDANNTVDRVQVSPDKVMGKTFFSVPYVGKLISSLNTKAGFLIFVIAPTLVFIVWELWKIKKEIEIQTEKRIMEKLQQQSQMNLEMALTKTSV